ncbi:FK506-binding protein-like [Coregonus clupeaformis]|uniref:FK506-binding protein-like n=1 Tax=Coregonus clupeaformis TaxID=59861 RepID=UPI001E1C71D7|nr:FK506-binding protein-like [Coregonus clupeaformis]
MKTSQSAETEGDEATSWVSVCPRGLWELRQRRKRGAEPADLSGDVYPGIGSLCRVRVQRQGEPTTDPELSLKPDLPITVLSDAQVTPLQRSQSTMLQVPIGDWIILRLGEGQCDITEGCVEGMRAGERCEVLLTPLTDRPGGGQEEQKRVDPDQSLCITVELQSFSPGHESWQLSAGEKWGWVMSHKQRGGDRFRAGDMWGAADSYSRALKLLITLKLHTRGEGEEMTPIEEESEEESEKKDSLEAPTDCQYRSTKASLYSNLSLCQLRLGQWSRARGCASRSTLLEPQGLKAWYRLGQACLEAGELEEADRAFRKLLELQNDSPSALRGLREVGRRERETDSRLGQRLGKMFS